MPNIFCFFLFFLVLLLSACGFKLRGQWQFNQDLNPLYLNIAASVAEEGDQLNLCLARQLTQVGIKLASQQQDNVANLVIRDIERAKTQISDNQLSAKEYELGLSTQVSLMRMAKDKPVQLLPVQAMSSVRRVVQDTNLVNASLAEELSLIHI